MRLIGEKVEELACTERIQPRRGEFDRECQPIEPAADLSSDWRVPVVKLELAATSGRALDEELHRWERQSLGCGKFGHFGWCFERRQAIDLFSDNPYGFTARGENPYPRGGGQERFCAGGHRFDDVLTIVEHKHEFPVGCEGGDRSFDIRRVDPQSHRRGDRRPYESRIVHGRQINEPDAIVIRSSKLISYCESQPRLADATRANDRQEARYLNCAPDCINSIASSHQTGC
jgi:hypothetical protein